MPTSSFNPILTLLATDRPSDPVSTGIIEKVNQNTARRFWYAGVAAKTANYTVLPTDTIVFTDTATIGAFTVTLPLSSTVPGMMVTFKQLSTGTNVCTIARSGSDTIDGATSNTSLNAQYDSITLMADGGSAWLIVGLYP